jgi:hypothetical protein
MVRLGGRQVLDCRGCFGFAGRESRPGRLEPSQTCIRQHIGVERRAWWIPRLPRQRRRRVRAPPGKSAGKPGWQRNECAERGDTRLPPHLRVRCRLLMRDLGCHAGPCCEARLPRHALAFLVGQGVPSILPLSTARTCAAFGPAQIPVQSGLWGRDLPLRRGGCPAAKICRTFRLSALRRGTAHTDQRRGSSSAARRRHAAARPAALSEAPTSDPAMAAADRGTSETADQAAPARARPS